MAGYIGSKSSVTLVDGYTEAEADAEFVTKTGDSMTGNLSLGDNNKAIFGAGSDLQIYHDGSNSYIKDAGTGALFLKTNYLALQGTNGHQIINAEQGAAVELYHNNSKKIETTSTGVTVTGGVYLGGTASANKLDDYEEGSFNLTMTGGSGNPSATQLLGSTYVKIGKLVSFRSFGTLNNTGASGAIAFSGLPFTPTGVTIANIECNSQGTFSLSPYGYVSGTVIYIQQMRSNNTYAVVNHNVASSGEWSITGHFFTNS